MRIIAGLVETTARYEEPVIIGAIFIYDLGKKTNLFYVNCIHFLLFSFLALLLFYSDIVFLVM